jgi:hypothetical protein
MNRLGKAIALALLVAVISPMLPAQVYFSTLPRPAGCHEHGQKAPAPRPVSYQCCRAGHQFAAVRETVNLGAPFLQMCPLVESAVIRVAGSGRQGQAEPPVFDSSGVTSLRI